LFNQYRFRLEPNHIATIELYFPYVRDSCTFIHYSTTCNTQMKW